MNIFLSDKIFITQTKVVTPCMSVGCCLVTVLSLVIGNNSSTLWSLYANSLTCLRLHVHEISQITKY